MRRRSREVERVAHHPLDAEGGVDGCLVRDLVGRAAADRSAVSDVRSLGALAHHDEVDLAGIGERTRRARVELRRPQVHVVVELEPQLQQQAALDVGILQTRVSRHSPDRAEQDRVVTLDRLEVGIRERVAGLEESRRAE